MTLRVGIITPVVHINPRFNPPDWESTGTIDDVVAIAQAAEGFGYDWVSAPEHVAIPYDATGMRGPRYWDPVATLSYVAAHTTRIGLLSHIVVLSYHHPLEIVKRWGTVDVLSGGRVILGVGVGSLQPEFDLLGREFAGRGARGDDAIRAIRAAWGRHVPEFAGTHWSFRDFVVEPSGVPRRLEIWVGGQSRRSLRRAALLGDAWIPFRLTEPELRELAADKEINEIKAPARARSSRSCHRSHRWIHSETHTGQRSAWPGSSRSARPASACASVIGRASTTWSSWQRCRSSSVK
ncbi:MAG: TIGR03619 family F420-dependent LLM class oxidoreductase [Actinomycetes bacterium]